MEIVRLSTLDDWADTVAARFTARLAARPAPRLCLATGNTPLPLYDRCVAAVRAGAASFRDAEAFLLDEFGGVPREAEGRCEQMLRRALIDQVDLPAARFHTIDTDAADLEAICRQYEAAVGTLDLTLLGIGTNGHIGMNEPGAPPDSLTRRVDLSDETQRSATHYFGGRHTPTWGVTAGMATVLRSREIWLLATGSSKAAILRRLMTEPVSPLLPASLLRQHPRCILFCDDAAAAELPPAPPRPA